MKDYENSNISDNFPNIKSSITKVISNIDNKMNQVTLKIFNPIFLSSDKFFNTEKIRKKHK